MGSSVSCCKKKSQKGRKNKILQQSGGRVILTTEANSLDPKIIDSECELGSSEQSESQDEELGLSHLNRKNKKSRLTSKKGGVTVKKRRKKEKAEPEKKVELTANFLFSMTFSNFYKAPIMERQREESSSPKNNSIPSENSGKYGSLNGKSNQLSIDKQYKKHSRHQSKGRRNIEKTTKKYNKYRSESIPRYPVGHQFYSMERP